MRWRLIVLNLLWLLLLQLLLLLLSSEFNEIILSNIIILLFQQCSFFFLLHLCILIILSLRTQFSPNSHCISTNLWKNLSSTRYLLLLLFFCRHLLLLLLLMRRFLLSLRSACLFIKWRRRTMLIWYNLSRWAVWRWLRRL